MLHDATRTWRMTDVSHVAFPVAATSDRPAPSLPWLPGWIRTSDLGGVGRRLDLLAVRPARVGARRVHNFMKDGASPWR